MNKHIIVKGNKHASFVSFCSYSPKGKGRIAIQVEKDDSIEDMIRNSFFSIPSDASDAVRDVARGILEKRPDVAIRSIDVTDRGDMLINAVSGGELYAFVVRSDFNFYIYDGDMTPHKYSVDYSFKSVRVDAYELNDDNEWEAVTELIVDANGDSRLIELVKTPK